MGNVKRLRSIHSLFLMIKEQDTDTEVTEYLIRKLVYGGYIPSVETGNKRLANFEDVCAFLFEGKRWADEK